MNPRFEAYARSKGRDVYAQAVSHIEDGGEGFQKWLDQKFDEYLKIKGWTDEKLFTQQELAEFKEWVVESTKQGTPE